jgi:hypothetical protein
MGKIDDRFFHIVHSRKPLSEEQRREIRSHPHESAHILAPLEGEHPGLRQIVSAHHECWDGSGYPHGLAGEEIPLASRVIALADAFDAMTQPRKYRPAKPVGEAIGELCEGAGAQFDPRLSELVASSPVRDEGARSPAATSSRRRSPRPNSKLTFSNLQRPVGWSMNTHSTPNRSSRWRASARTPQVSVA